MKENVGKKRKISLIQNIYFYPTFIDFEFGICNK